MSATDDLRPHDALTAFRASAAAAPIEVPFRVLAETAPDAIVTIDEDSRILTVNDATLRLFGWSAEELLGQRLTMLMPEEFRARHENGMGRYLRSGRRNIPWSSVPLPGLTRDGRPLSLEVSFGEFELNGQRVFSGFLRDVSDRVAAQLELEQTTAELQQALAALRERVHEAESARQAADLANEAKSQFLATMSHELRTPLNAIGGYLELLEMGLRGPLSDQQQEDLRRIRRAQGRLLTLINDVLNFARLERGRMEYDLRAVRVNPLLCSLGALIEPQLRARQLTYECQPGAPDVTLCADQQKLEQILLNLLSNAIKFTEPGGHIRLTTDADDDSVRIHVQDTGVGVPHARLEAIFEPFVQVDATLTRAHEGTGLGLAISRQLAHGMGGLLTVESALGQGTTFTVSLPAGGIDRGDAPRATRSVGEPLARDARAIVRGMVARLRADPDLPPVTDAELEDHMASLLTDLAQLLVIVDAGGGHDRALVGDGARIQQVILELHADQRRRLGWTPELLAREFDYLAQEAADAIRRRPSPGGVADADDLIALVHALLEEAKLVGLRRLSADPTV
jgi:PAS domain S-box-containing protein